EAARGSVSPRRRRPATAWAFRASHACALSTTGKCAARVSGLTGLNCEGGCKPCRSTKPVRCTSAAALKPPGNDDQRTRCQHREGNVPQDTSGCKNNNRRRCTSRDVYNESPPL